MTEGINIYFECFLTGLCGGAQKAAPAEERVGVMDLRIKTKTDVSEFLTICYDIDRMNRKSGDEKEQFYGNRDNRSRL